MAKEPKRKGLKAVLRNWLLGPVSSAGSILGMYTNGIDAGVTVNTDTALRFTAVYAAIKLLAENIAGLPKSVMVRTKDGGYESAAKHPAHSLLYVRPNSWMDVFTFWFTIIAWLMGKGNAFAATVGIAADIRVELARIDKGNAYARMDLVSAGELFLPIDQNGAFFAHAPTCAGVIDVKPVVEQNVGKGIAVLGEIDLVADSYLMHRSL